MLTNASFLRPIMWAQSIKIPYWPNRPKQFTGLKLGKPATVAAGVTAVLKSMEFSWGEAGVGRGTHALLKLNQKDGFDCSSCAWPDPDDHRSVAEFCENGAKATASDADHPPGRSRVFRQTQPGRLIAHDRPRPEQRRSVDAPDGAAARRHALHPNLLA